MAHRTRDELLSDLLELRESYAKAIEMIENQQGQLSLALTVLAELGFDLADFAVMLG